MKSLAVQNPRTSALECVYSFINLLPFKEANYIGKQKYVIYLNL